MVRVGVSLLVFLWTMASACAPASGGVGRGGDPSAGVKSDDRTLVYALRAEPTTLAARNLSKTGVGGASGLFDSGLARSDPGTDAPRPNLAEALPQYGSDSWKVFPDGRMETTWRLRPNVTYHDGTPLVADDLVFAFQVYRLPEFDGPRLAGGFLDAITAPDPQTVVIHWKNLYPLAGQSDGTIPALPRHLLAASFEQVSLPAFEALPFWTSQFVGLGPYRLEAWEPGAFIRGTAFPGYVHGQAKISRVNLVWVTDANTAVANLLAGAVHFTPNEVIGFEQTRVLKREWVATGAGTLLLNPDKTRYVQVQYKTEYTRPNAVIDRRVRQALAHAIDKQSLVEAMLDGEQGMANAALSNRVDYFPEVDKAVTKYPFDLRRAEQLLAQAGFTRDGEAVRGQDGNRLTTELWAFAGQGEREAVVLNDHWKRAGVEAPLRILSPAEAQDRQLISTYPAFRIDQMTASEPYNQFSKVGYATAANNWTGSNRGGFADPEYDRSFEIYQTTLDATERVRAGIQMNKVISDQVAFFPLYYAYLVQAHTSSLVGPGVAHVHEWYFR